MIRAFALVGLALLTLSACGSDADNTASDDPAAGLSAEISGWSKALEASHPACSTKVEGKGCQDFQVTCKAYQEISNDEAAKGVTSQVVAAMTFASRNADGSTGKSGSAFGLFSKARDGWTRDEASPVNLQSCAPL